MSETLEREIEKPTPDAECNPSRARCLQRQNDLSSLAHRLSVANQVTEDEALLLYSAAEEQWDDAIHVAAPWTAACLCAAAGDVTSWRWTARYREGSRAAGRAFSPPSGSTRPLLLPLTETDRRPTRE